MQNPQNLQAGKFRYFEIFAKFGQNVRFKSICKEPTLSSQNNFTIVGEVQV